MLKGKISVIQLLNIVDGVNPAVIDVGLGAHADLRFLNITAYLRRSLLSDYKHNKLNSINKIENT